MGALLTPGASWGAMRALMRLIQLRWAKLSLKVSLQSVARWVTEAEQAQRLLLGETGEAGYPVQHQEQGFAESNE